MSEERSAAGESAQGAPGEAELASLTSTDVMLQAAVLLLNLGGRRLGLVPPSASAEARAAAGAERDLEQVRDAIDAVSPSESMSVPRESLRARSGNRLSKHRPAAQPCGC